MQLGEVDLGRLWALMQIEFLNSGSMEQVTKIWDSLLLRFGDFVETYETFIDRIFTLSHLISKYLILVLWLTQFRITTCFLQVRWLSNHQLTHFVNKLTLVARQESQYCCGLKTLPMNKLSQVKLLIQGRLWLQEQLIKALATLKFCVAEQHIFDWFKKLEIKLDALKKGFFICKELFHEAILNLV